MATSYWEDNPFGARSIFHPDHRKGQGEKVLKIRHLSTTANETDYLLKFEIITKNLSNTNARIYVEEVELGFHETAVPPTPAKLNSTATQSVTLKFSKKKTFSKTILEGEFEFRATITCDGLSADTSEFRLKLEKVKIDSKIVNEKNNKIYASDKDWAEAISKLNINEINLFKAVAYQESFLEPFLGIHTKILFERHRFYEKYANKYGEIKAIELSKLYPNLIHKNSGGYGNEKFFDIKTGKYDKHSANDHQFERLENAIKIDSEIAIESTSFGIFQLMGENHIYISDTHLNFMNDMEKSEIFQIDATVNFLLKEKSKKEFSNALNSKNWESVASIFNGKHWKKHNPKYAENLSKYYNEKPWLK